MIFEERTLNLEEHRYAVELELDSRWTLVEADLWEAVLQYGRQGDEGHCSVEGKTVDKNLEQRTCCYISLNLRLHRCTHSVTRILTLESLKDGNGRF